MDLVGRRESVGCSSFKLNGEGRNRFESFYDRKLVYTSLCKPSLFVFNLVYLSLPYVCATVHSLLLYDCILYAFAKNPSLRNSKQNQYPILSSFETSLVLIPAHTLPK